MSTSVPWLSITFWLCSNINFTCIDYDQAVGSRTDHVYTEPGCHVHDLCTKPFAAHIRRYRAILHFFEKKPYPREHGCSDHGSVRCTARQLYNQ